MEGNEQEQGQQEQQEAVSFDSWFEGQDEGIKGLVEDHLNGLKSALTAERAERKKLAAQIKDLGGKAEKGSELATQLEKLTGDMGKLDQKAQFYEDAHNADVANLRLAWTAAQEYDLVGKDGKVDMDKLREFVPELFKKKTPTPPGNAGAGAGQTGTATPTMNGFIRKAAGR